MPRRALCACTKCAPWLGVPTAIWIRAVRTPWVRSGNAVTAQWGLLECYEDTVGTQRGLTWSPRERCCRTWLLHGDPTECMETSLRLPPPHGASTAFALRLNRIAFVPLHPHGDHIELPRRSLRSHGATTESAFAGRWHSDHSSQLRFKKEKMAHKPFLWACSTN